MLQTRVNSVERLCATRDWSRRLPEKGNGGDPLILLPSSLPTGTECRDSLYRESNKAFASLGSEALLRFVAYVAVTIFFSSSREGEVRLAELNLGRTLLVKD